MHYEYETGKESSLAAACKFKGLGTSNVEFLIMFFADLTDGGAK